jgi:hypothetical protein
VILPKSRALQSATLLLALVCAPCSFSQSSFAVPTSAVSFVDSTPLPNAPSFSSSADQAPDQSQAQAPAQAAPAQADPAQQQTPDQKKADERAEAERQVQQQEKQRIGGIMPNFNVRMGGPFVPLTPAEKWSLSWHTIVDPYTIALAFVVGGGLGEAEDDHQGYDWGAAGYFKRTGASYLDNIDGNFIGNFLLPVVLHQDPRYFRKGNGSIKSRIIYSALTTFICKGDNGKTQFNISNIAGNFISGGLSNIYYPSDERGASLTVENAVTVTLEGMLGAQLFEFSPDITNYIHKRRDHHRMVQQQQIDAAAAAKMANPPAAPKP